MYVRWLHKPLKDDAFSGDISHRAYLIVSKRRDGQPRTKVVAYLGSLRESQMKDDQERRDFLSTARKTVETHCRDALQRKAAWARLAEVVAIVEDAV